MKRYMIKEIKNITENDKEYLAKGWVCYKRDLGKTKFLVLQDRSGELQAVADDNPELRDAYQKINLGDVIAVRGRAHEEERAPGGIELKVEQLEIVNPCEQPTPIPLDRRSHRKDTDINKRLDYRYLDLRYKPVADIFKLRAEFTKAVREYLNMNDFIEIQTPKIVAAATEGGANLFPIEYFNTDAYLAQSPQFYKQMMMASGLERVFEIAPAFRAERHNTIRHVNEFTSIDLEMSFIESDEDIMEIEENMLAYSLEKLVTFAKENDIKANIKVPKLPFQRLDAEQIYGILKEKGQDVVFGEDIKPEYEKIISSYIKEKTGEEFVFLTKYPAELRPLYAKKDESNPRMTKSFDLLYRGSEITTGGQRINSYEELKQAFIDKGRNPEDYKFYLDTFRYGMPPHGGLGLGLDRFIALLAEKENIREAVLFPRDKSRLVP